MKILRQLFTLIIFAACLTACAPRWRPSPGSFVNDYDRQLYALMRYAEPDYPYYDYGDFWRIGADSIRSVITSFWDARDPFPETELNEYRNLIEARFTTTWDSLISGRTIRPDRRIVPRVFHGCPTRTSEIRIGREDAQVFWFYEPPFAVTPEVMEHPLLRDLTYCFIFTRDRWGHHGIDTEAENPFPPLPHLSEAEVAELAGLITAGDSPIEVRLAAVWRLRADPGHHALRALLTSARMEDERVRQSILAAVHPLQIAFTDQTGEPVPVAAELDSARWNVGYIFNDRIRDFVRARALQRFLYAGEPDSLYMAHMLAQPYDPAAELPADVVEDLRKKAEEEAVTLAGRGWLTREAADTLFTGPLAEARALLDTEDPMAAHSYLEPYLRGAYRQNGEAWNLDALALMQSGEPGGRDMAEESARKALRLDPGNLRYALTLAEVQFQRTFDRYGDRALDRILQEAPSMADAHALKGKLRLEIVWGIGWRAGGWGTPLKGMSASMSDVEAEALAYLNSALVLDPDNAFATWWLGMHNMLTGRWIDVVRIMDYLINHGVHSAEAFLGRGLAYQNLGLLERAMDDYRQGISLLPPSVRAIADDPRWTLPLSEDGIGLAGSVRIETVPARRTSAAGAATGAAAGPPGTGGDRDRFWRAKDPLFGTDLNERLLEQYRRFAHITWHFAVPHLGLAGWETHRGRIYMRFGEPLTIEEVERRRIWGGPERVDVPEVLSPGGQAGGMGLARYEYWYYDGFRIPLMIGMLTGNRIMTYDHAYQELVEVIPESPRVSGHRDVIDMDALDLGLRWYWFENEVGETELYLHTQFPKPRLVGVQGDTLSNYTAHLTILDEQWSPLTRREVELPYWIFMYDRSLPLVTRAFQLQPEWLKGECLYGAVEIMPPGPGPAYAGRDTIQLAMGDTLRMSSLMAAEYISDVEESGDLFPGTFITRGNRNIIPTLDDRFHFDRPLYLYVEIYGLELDRYNMSRYRLAVETTALGEDAPSPMIEALGRLVRTERRDVSVRLIFEREGIGTTAVEENRIAFSTEEPAEEYQITVEITDMNAGRTVRKTVRLKPYVDSKRWERLPPPQEHAGYSDRLLL